MNTHSIEIDVRLCQGHEVIYILDRAREFASAELDLWANTIRVTWDGLSDEDFADDRDQLLHELRPFLLYGAVKHPLPPYHPSRVTEDPDELGYRFS